MRPRLTSCGSSRLAEIAKMGYVLVNYLLMGESLYEDRF